MSLVEECNDDVQVLKVNQSEDINGTGDGKKSDIGKDKVDEEKSHELSRRNNKVKGFSKRNDVSIKSSLGLIGCVVNIAKFVFAGIFSLIVNNTGINWALQLFGIELRPIDDLNSKGEKRKRSDVDTEDDVEDTENKEAEMKRWRPDHVYEAINEFVKKMWGEKDDNENIKVDANVPENDENMNFADVNDGKWNKKPDINFIPEKSIGIKDVSEAEDFIRDLTPKKIDTYNLNLNGKGIQIVIDDQTDSFGEDFEENYANIAINGSLGDVIKDEKGQIQNVVETSTPLITGQVPQVFVFSGDKSIGPKVDEDLPEDEPSMLALMTFQEKKVYFALQIKEQEEAAQKSAIKKSPRPGAKSVAVSEEEVVRVQ